MTALLMDLSPLLLIGFSALLLMVLTAWKRHSPANIRKIPSFARLYRNLGSSIEEGSRLHVALGHGSLLDVRGGSSLAGLAALRVIAEKTAASDLPVVASSGDPTLGLLSQDTMQSGYQAAGMEEAYLSTRARVTGLTPFGYAAGAMQIPQNEKVSSNIAFGHFGTEVALIADASDWHSVTLIGASDDLNGQAVLFASTEDALIGEEMFASSAYLGAGPAHLASLTVQDILRWLIILALLGGAALEFLGMI